MNKHDLVGATLEQLLDAFHSSPESFELEDKEHCPNKYNVGPNPTIFWQPKYELKDNQVVPDPTIEPKTVIVVYNVITGEIGCYLFARSGITSSDLTSTKADALVSSIQTFHTIRGNYRKFMKLKKLIIQRDRNRESDKFLRKLCSIFPAAVDRHLLGK